LDDCDHNGVAKFLEREFAEILISVT